MKKSLIIWLLIIITIIIVLIIIGLIGGQEAGKLTYDCKLGLGDRLCWIWEKNRLGEFADIFKK